MKYFKNHESMLAEAEQLINEDRFDAEDRSTIQDFYNGRETMNSCEAEKRGVDNVTNHLFGYDSLNAAAGQLNGIYTKGEVMFNIKAPNAPMENRKHWECKTTEILNSVIKESRRFKPEWKSLCGEVTLFGRGVLMHLDNEDWCPKMARPYVPRGTGILSNEVPYLVLPDFLTIVELEDALKKAEYATKNGWDPYWSISSLKTFIDMLKGNLGSNTGYSSPLSSANMPYDEAAELRQAGADGASGMRAQIPVYYFYYKNESGRFDMTILPRVTASQQKTLTERSIQVPSMLYERKDYFEKPSHFLHPYFIDCELGGKTSWHRVMGLGRLNYEPDVETEEFFNDAMQGSRENLRRLYQVGTAADWDMIKTWAAGNGPTNVLPPGVTLAEARMSPNFQHAFTTMDMLMNLSRKNAASSVPNAANANPDELQVNAMERQGRNAEMLSNRISDVYDCTDALGIEIFRRFIAETPLPQDQGYAEVKEFQRRLKQAGIPIAHFRKVIDGKYVNFSIMTSRAVGDGSKVKQAMANQMLMSRLHLFNSEAQQVILRRITAEETGDYDFATQVVPYQHKDDPNQVERANQENDTADKLGIIGEVPQLNEDDIDAVHLPHHLKSMQADLARGKIRPWDDIDLAGFRTKGAHASMHVKKLKAIPEQKQMAQEFEQALQAMAKQGQEFENNLNKQKEANELTAKDKADLELKNRKQGLAEHAQSALEEHREAALNVTRRKAAVTETTQLNQAALNEQNTMHQQRMAEADKMLSARDQGMSQQEQPSAEEEAAVVTTEEPVSSEDNPLP